MSGRSRRVDGRKPRGRSQSVRQLGLAITVALWAGTSGCRGDGGACGYCDQADDGCLALCERTCPICTSVDPDLVESVSCLDEKLFVHTDDGHVHVCMN